jgi:threonine synthase
MSGTGGYLQCASCSAQYSSQDARWHCDCGGYLDYLLPTGQDAWNTTADAAGMWRYMPMLPLKQVPVSLGEPLTPVVSIDWYGHALKVKCEQLFPTGSFKDRGAAVMLAKARELGITEVVEDSSGNAGAAVAAYGAANGMHCHIYVPASTTATKKRQITQYGATLHAVPGSREAAARKAFEAASHAWFASHCWSPWFVQGTQTFAFELYEQLGNTAPDIVVLPVGNGTLLLGAWLGFSRLATLGLIARTPRIIGVQAASCAPLYHAFHHSTMPAPQASAAQGICVATPLRSQQILLAIRASCGTIVTVEEQQIVAAHRQLAQRGIAVEPTSAVVFAALAHHRIHVKSNQIVVTVFTGHGLKSQ